MLEADNSINPAGRPNHPRAYRLGDLLGAWDLFAEEAYQAKLGNKPMGICTNMDKVNDAIGGTFQPGLHSLQGGTGVGKTAFALQIAATCGFPALYVTCEMAPLELLRRITARVTGTYLGKFKSGELPPDTSHRLVMQAIATCPNLVILDATRGYIPAFESVLDKGQPNMYDLVETMRDDSKHVLVVIDSLHSWTGMAPDYLKEYEALNLGISSLGSLAASLNCPILAISERNRASIDKGGVSAGAGSRKIEYSAESVIELDVTNAALDGNDEKRISVGLSKNRNGITGRPVELYFSGRLQQFREV